VFRVIRNWWLGCRTGDKTESVLAVVERAGEQHVDPFVLAGITGPPLEGAEAGRGEGEFHAFQLRRFAGDYIDYGKEGIGAVERRTRSADDFHALDQVDIHQELRA